LHIDKKSETLKVIQHLRNEAHRFGISHYRKRHTKSLIHSELEDIPGIGEQTVTLLLKKYKSVTKIKNLSAEELIDIVGKSKAEKIIEYFKNKANSTNDL
jgi:excinuclease ABC subunit C